MSATNDRAMDRVCRELIEIAERDEEEGMFDGEFVWQKRLIEKTLLIEAYGRGEDLTHTKLAMTDEDTEGKTMSDVSIQRVTKAIVDATDWEKKRDA